MFKPRTLTALVIPLALAACDTRGDAEPAPEATPEISADPMNEATVSILRPDIVQPELPVPALVPLKVTIGFPEGGSALDDAAQEALRGVLASDQLSMGGPIALDGHSDSGGNDSANQSVSRARAEAVRDWLVDNGVSADRITITAFGEQNPAGPNALPDGSPNEEGRAANRRVELRIMLPGEPASAQPGD